MTTGQKLSRPQGCIALETRKIQQPRGSSAMGYQMNAVMRNRHRRPGKTPNVPAVVPRTAIAVVVLSAAPIDRLQTKTVVVILHLCREK